MENYDLTNNQSLAKDLGGKLIDKAEPQHAGAMGIIAIGCVAVVRLCIGVAKEVFK